MDFFFIACITILYGKTDNEIIFFLYLSDLVKAGC